jgi:hypothetical protein
VPLANKAFTASQAVTGARQDTKTELHDHHHHHHHHHHAHDFFVIGFWVRAGNIYIYGYGLGRYYFRGNQGIDNVIELMMNPKCPRRYGSVEDKTCHSRTKHSLQARL